MKSKIIVAIGFSAGGLAPLLKFFDNAPLDHTSYVILRHLRLTDKSQLKNILVPYSQMEVVEAENGIMLEKNKIYLLPTGHHMITKQGRLYFVERIPLYPNWAVDVFLDSLASDKGKNSIAVILSGTGCDGTKGSARVKESGGLVVAQQPESCEYPSMPLSIIRAGNADHVLLPGEMPETILNYAHKL
jgi:two-component system CheB/CheR fusion protein